MVLANSTNVYSNSRYVVGAGTPFTTVQSAINAAQAAGGNATVWVRAGTYTENLTLYDTVNIEGADSALSIIVGTHTPPTSGAMNFIRVGLNSATHILTSAAAGTAIITFSRCVFNLTNGYVCNMTNWTGALKFRYCIDNSTANGIVTNTAGAPISINHGLLGVGANVLTANGNVSLFSVDMECPILVNGTGTSKFLGGCDFSANISTANTHNLKIAQCRIESGAAQAITHNSATTLVLDSVIVNSLNATALGGTGTIKEVNVQYPNSNVIAGTITQSLDGVTRTAEMWSDNISRTEDTGFYSWAAAGPYFDDTTLGTFKLLVGGTGYIKGKRVTWVAQNYTGMTAGTTYFIYIDSTGTIGAATSHLDANYVNYIMLFECLRDSTPVTNNQVTVAENHPYAFQVGPSNYLHDVVGPVIENNSNGANITLNGTQGIQINGADVLSDHGLNTTIPDSAAAAVTWIKMYTTAAGKWARQNATTTFTGFWNNAGTATALTAGRFAVYTLYVSKNNLNSATPTYFAVLDIAQYTSQGAANTAIANGTPAKITNELALLEMAQLGYITYRESTAAITSVVISKSTLRQTLSTGGTNQASLITTNVTNFNGVLSSADTNVQAALETIDEYRGGLFRSTATANGPLLSNYGYIVKNATPANLTTLTLPATPILGDTIAVNGYTAGGWSIAQNANQQIFMGALSTTIGVGGSLSSTGAKDAIRITCVTAGAASEWITTSAIGNLLVV